MKLEPYPICSVYTGFEGTRVKYFKAFTFHIQLSKRDKVLACWEQVRLHLLKM